MRKSEARRGGIRDGEGPNPTWRQVETWSVDGAEAEGRRRWGGDDADHRRRVVPMRTGGRRRLAVRLVGQNSATMRGWTENNMQQYEGTPLQDSI